MPQRAPRVFSIRVPEYISCVRSAAVTLAADLKLDRERQAAVALVVGELATNLLGHAGGGKIRLRGLRDKERAGVEVLALDRGPGIPDLELCLRDGYSSAGTMGAGLGIVYRLSDEFELFSRLGQGTLVRSRIWKATDLRARLASARSHLRVPQYFRRSLDPQRARPWDPDGQAAGCSTSR